jgi:hypothetical protein
MKAFFVGLGLLIAGSAAAIIPLLAYALAAALTALILGLPVMAGFAVASASSDGVIPAFGYVTSSALTYIVLIPTGFSRSGVSKQKDT